MDAVLIRERYKLIRVLYAQEDYVCAEAVDILDREKRDCLLNIYEGALLRAYLPCFDQMEGCTAFLNMFTEGDSLVTVFRPCRGITVDQLFFRGDQHPWRDRLELAEQLFHEALNLADLMPEVGCAALLSENVFIQPEEKTVCLRFLIRPMEGMNPREVVWLATDQAKKLLRPMFSVPVEQLDFLEELEQGRCTNVVQLYALWRARRETLQQAYEALEKKNFFWRALTLAWSRLKRSRKRRKRR